MRTAGAVSQLGRLAGFSRNLLNEHNLFNRDGVSDVHRHGMGVAFSRCGEL